MMHSDRFCVFPKLFNPLGFKFRSKTMLFGEYVCICCRLVTIEKRLLITKQTCELLTAAYSVVYSSSDGWEYESICPTTASFWKEASVKKKINMMRQFWFLTDFPERSPSYRPGQLLVRHETSEWSTFTFSVSLDCPKLGVFKIDSCGRDSELQ